VEVPVPVPAACSGSGTVGGDGGFGEYSADEQQHRARLAQTFVACQRAIWLRSIEASEELR
jgi:hypothetical protein